MRKYDELQLMFDGEGWEDFELGGSESGPDEGGGALSPGEARLISEGARKAFELRMRSGELVDSQSVLLTSWWGDYLKLMEQGWPWRVACYMAWAASPKVNRWPKTLQELATEVLGLAGPRVIYVWRQRHATIDTVVAMLSAAPLFEHRRDIFEAMVASATNPDYKGFNDRKLALEMLGDYTPRSQLDLGRSVGGGLDEMSDEELRKWLGETPPLTPPQRENTAGEGEEEEDGA